MDTNCQFCEEINGNQKERVVYESENFVVFPTKGGFVLNYLLIVSKKHYTCMGDLSVDEMKEMSNIISRIKEVNASLGYMSCVLFEHGGRNNNENSGTSITHAHMHIVPSEVSCLDKIRTVCKDIKMIDSIEDLQQATEGKETYLYYQDIDSKHYVIFHEGIPSQFVRRLLCEEMNLGDKWDWRKYPMYSNIEKTIELWKEIKF